MLNLEQCKETLLLFKLRFGEQFGIEQIGIFGSVARNEQTEESDLDIFVEINKPDLQTMFELREQLSSLFKCKIDLIRLRNSLRPVLKQNILKDAVYV